MSNYERELREILAGNEEIIRSITKTCNEEEVSKYRKIIGNPFITVRAAGSLGIADLVAIRGDISFIIEIKVRKEPTILFSHEGGRMQRMAEEMQKKCAQSRILPLFAFRVKGVRGDSWRIFTMALNGLTEMSLKLYRVLPKLEQSKEGNYIMRWENGMKLADFIGILSNS